MTHILQIGAGNMGRAFLQGILKSTAMTGAAVTVIDRNPEKIAALKENCAKKMYGTDNIAGVNFSDVDVLILAVKPQQIKAVAQDIAAKLSQKTLVVSLAAGIHLSTLEALFQTKTIIRVMPNLPIARQNGISGVMDPTMSLKNIPTFQQALNDSGIVKICDSDEMIDRITILTGSGPAILLAWLKAFAKASELNPDAEFMKTFFLGTAEWANAQNADLEGLQSAVTSKGGTTAAFLESLDANNLQHVADQAFEAAMKRAKDLSSA